ncbi:MAG TPA: PilZ domain-containing protein [Terriglobales bacterium]|nr:PilZ domain-containing protein [Terriglobales bacterium]
MRQLDTGEGRRARAPRFRIQLPLRYRALGQQEWHSSQTHDISHSGVLFDAAEPLPPHTPLAMTVILQWARGPVVDPPEVSCLAHVVRAVPADGPGSGARLAAKFAEYDFPSGKSEPKQSQS